jgi:penicillin-binding protein 1A
MLARLLKGAAAFTLLISLVPISGVVLAQAPKLGPFVSYEPPWNQDGEIGFEPLAVNSKMLAKDGTQIALLHAEENREPVELTQVAPSAVGAVLAAEDQRFYQHSGVDLKSLARATIVNVSRGSVAQGGSTITQQVVKNSLLNPERTVGRKLKEIFLAQQLESQLPKNKILERYLNSVYFGNGAYGVGAAASTYFNKSPAELSVGESALLAGLIRSPLRYDPLTNPNDAKIRRREVLDEMERLGYISHAERDAADAEALPTRLHLKSQITEGPGDYFAEWVKQVLLKEPILGETASERYNALFKAGLTIETTLDMRLQVAAEEAIASQGPRGDRFTAALATVEVGSGAVRALAAGKDFQEFKYNLATQSVRGTGSSFKVFTLVAVLSKGIPPTDSVNGSSPCTLKMPGGGVWKARNYAGESGGVMSIREATAKSVNCAFARMILDVGVDAVVEAAKNMGLPGEIKRVPSITLGTQEESPVDMAGAFATLPTGGMRYKPFYVERILARDGRVIFEAEPKGEQTVDRCVALTAVDVLRSVVTSGTGRRASIGRQPIAGKTGTGEKYRDAWFVGFSPYLSTGVWVGSPDAEISMYNVNGFGSVAGGTIPAAVFSAFMARAHEGLEVKDFERPNCTIKGGKLQSSSKSEGPTASPDAETTSQPEMHPPTGSAPPTLPPSPPPPPSPAPSPTKPAPSPTKPAPSPT